MLSNFFTNACSYLHFLIFPKTLYSDIQKLTRYSTQPNLNAVQVPFKWHRQFYTT